MMIRGHPNRTLSSSFPRIIFLELPRNLLEIEYWYPTNQNLVNRRHRQWKTETTSKNPISRVVDSFHHLFHFTFVLFLLLTVLLFSNNQVTTFKLSRGIESNRIRIDISRRSAGTQCKANSPPPTNSQQNKSKSGRRQIDGRTVVECAGPDWDVTWGALIILLVVNLFWNEQRTPFSGKHKNEGKQTNPQTQY